MFGRHVEDSLLPYIEGKLDADIADRVRQHLGACSRCSAAHQELRFAAGLVRQLPLRSAPESVWVEIEQKLNADSAPLAGRRASARPSRYRRYAWAAIGALILILAAPIYQLSVRLGQRTPPAPAAAAWKIEATRGAPMVSNRALRGAGTLAAGEWLVTDANSAALVTIANIGKADIRPNTRLAIVSSAANQHRMRLERGELHAKVTAPPRIFLVDTPSATAVDLGCEYTLTANPDGTSLLRVRSGWVAMEHASQASYVPATMACITRSGRVPGTPYRQDAARELIAALNRFDFGGGSSSDLREILTRARKEDALTLWHLLTRVVPAEKRTVYDALNRRVPAPREAAFNRINTGDHDALEAWKNAIELMMFPAQGFNFTDLAVNVMQMQKKGLRK